MVRSESNRSPKYFPEACFSVCTSYSYEGPVYIYIYDSAISRDLDGLESITR